MCGDVMPKDVAAIAAHLALCCRVHATMHHILCARCGWRGYCKFFCFALTKKIFLVLLFEEVERHEMSAVFFVWQIRMPCATRQLAVCAAIQDRVSSFVFSSWDVFVYFFGVFVCTCIVLVVATVEEAAAASGGATSAPTSAR